MMSLCGKENDGSWRNVDGFSGEFLELVNT